MIQLWYNASPQLYDLASKAAGAWMKALNPKAVQDRLYGTNRIYLSPAPFVHADTIIAFGPVDRSASPSRIAQHELRNGKHLITLAHDVKWRVSWWQRVAGIGDHDAYAALLHEFGHALGLPHSNRVSDVMHADCGTTVISKDEAERYRRFLDANSSPLDP